MLLLYFFKGKKIYVKSLNPFSRSRNVKLRNILKFLVLRNLLVLYGFGKISWKFLASIGVFYFMKKCVTFHNLLFQFGSYLLCFGCLILTRYFSVHFSESPKGANDASTVQRKVKVSGHFPFIRCSFDWKNQVMNIPNTLRFCLQK